MPEIVQFINNNDQGVYRSLYEKEKATIRSCEKRTISEGNANPSVVIRQNKNRNNELEVVKTYVLDDDELVRRACGELNIMRRIHKGNAANCAAQLYEWSLICKDGEILESTRDKPDYNAEEMLNAVDPLKAAETEKINSSKKASTTIQNGYKQLMENVSKIEIVMEYGVPLDDFINESKSKSILIEAPDQKIRLLFAALSVLHNIGIVHEDIKPPNIVLVERAGRVVPVFIDFDVSALHNVYHIPFVKYTGSTPYYASPEQLGEAPCDPDTVNEKGEPKLTPKTDVYSMAVIAFGLLGTPLPEERDDRMYFVNAYKQKNGIYAVLANALVKSPGTRYDAGGILNGLMEAMGEKPALNEIQVDQEPSGRKKWGMIVAFAAILGVVILGVRNILQLSSIPGSDSTSTETVSDNGGGVYQEGSGNVQGTNVNITIYHQYPTSAELSNADSITTTSPSVTSNAAETTMTGDDENGEINATNFSGVVATYAIINNFPGEPKEEQKANSSPATNSIAEITQPTTTTTKDTTTTTTTAGVGVENGFAYSLENGTATITGYQGTATVVVIPESLAGVPVYAIGEKAFANKEITSVEILGSNVSGVQRIEKEAFRGCTYLKQVILPISIKYIGPDAFTRNYDAESIIIYYRDSDVGWKEIEKTAADFEKDYIQTSFNYGTEW